MHLCLNCSKDCHAKVNASGGMNMHSIPGMTQFHGHYHPTPQEYRPGN